jgi:MFS family permease
VRDTAQHVAVEQAAHPRAEAGAPPLRWAFAEATFRHRSLRSCSQAGFTNNLNDALAWGVLPLFLASDGASASEIGAVAGLYPAVWATAQIGTGHWSDLVGRKPLIVAGMVVQAAALALLAASGGAVPAAALAAVSLGLGTALVYPTLIAAISDAVSPVERAPAVGIYRFWRDMGYVAGGLIAGIAADAIDYSGAIALVAGLTAVSGLWVMLDMPPPASRPRDTDQQRAPRAELADEVQGV